VTADHQTAGRGRLGRAWIDAPATTVMCSILLKPPPERRVAELTLVAAVATAQVVEHALGRAAPIKWPNDVLVDGRKVSGGLAELRDGAVILGIGMNVNQTEDQLPPNPRIPAASLRTIDGQLRDRESLLDELLDRLGAAYRAWLDSGLAALREELDRRDFLRDRDVTIGSVSGVARGIGDDGRLIVETSAGLVSVESGEVGLDHLPADKSSG
jgi:BirA family biotin operon repressor/biotin-[acetyl-CoA-carboxylase] ligase